MPWRARPALGLGPPLAVYRQVQLVDAMVDKPNAVPQPGTAVYTVLSGSFDQLP